MNPFDLTGRVAIVTGGNRGIGFGIARGLAAAGATLVIAARDAAKARDAVEALRATGAETSFVETDIVEQASCQRLAEAAVERHGRIDILVNNAGRALLKPPEDCTLDEWNAMLAGNLTGAFLCAQAVFPAMRDQGGGKIVNIGSLASVLGSRLGTAYAASKGGILQLTRSLAVSWGVHRIQVNAILPGYTNTDMTSMARATRQGFEEAVVARTPLGRWGEPADFAGLAVFLASSASDFITGTGIPVDGGYSIQL